MLALARAVIGAICCTLMAACGSASGSVPATPETFLHGKPVKTMAGDLYVSNRPGTLYPGSNVVCPTWISVYRNGAPTFLRKLPGLCKGNEGKGALAFDRSGTLYWADSFNGAVLVYRAGATKPSYTIGWGAPGASSLAVTANGTLFVANLGPFGLGYGASSISVYAPGKDVPSYTITDGISFPQYVTLDSRGNLYVANCPACSSHYAGVSEPSSVSEYAPGKKTPARVLTDGVTGPVALAIGPTGTLHVANEVTCGVAACTRGSVADFEQGSSTPARTLAQGLDNPIGLTVDAADTIYVAAQNAVQVFRAGASSAALTLPSTSGCKSSSVTLDAAGHLYVLQRCTSGSSISDSFIDVYEPQSNKIWYAIERDISNAKNFAIAP